MKQIHSTYHFVERDYVFNKILHNSPYLTFQQIDQILDDHLDDHIDWRDLTFTFYTDGSSDIYDNNYKVYLKAKHLNGYCLDAYVRKCLDFIKIKLNKTNEKELMIK